MTDRFGPCSAIAIAFCFTQCCIAGDEASLRHAVVRDSAMMRSDFEKLINPKTPPRSVEIHDKSLTLAILSLDVGKQNDIGFRFETDSAPKPAEIFPEIYRLHEMEDRKILTSPVTAIHDDRIALFQFKIDGDVAQGRVDFVAPGLYKGTALFIAKRHESGWLITDFNIPNCGVTLTRGDGGLWKEVKQPKSESFVPFLTEVDGTGDDSKN